MTRPPLPGKIVCVGRNYALHAAELGHDVPSEPLIFLKPPSSLIADGDEIVAPPWAGRVDYEGEIGLVVGKRAKRVTRNSAWEFISGVVPLNDVTARDLQRSDGQWSRAKGFDTFCPIGSIAPLAGLEIDELSVTTTVNSEVRQTGSIDEMIFHPTEIIEYITRFATLEPGDLIATGTPAGVGPLVDGDLVEVAVKGAGSVGNRFRRADPQP